MAEKIFKFLIESQDDEIIKSTSIKVNLIYDGDIQTYYIPHIFMKIINPLLYTEKEVNIHMQKEETIELFFEVCMDALEMAHFTTLIDSKNNLSKYSISQKINPLIYSGFTTPQFGFITPQITSKEKYDDYIKVLSNFPEYSEIILKQYYQQEKTQFLYKLMDEYDINISCDILEKMILFMEQGKFYKLDIISKFGDVHYIYDTYKGEWYHYYYAYASVKKYHDEFRIKGPFLKKEENGMKISVWNGIKKDLEEKIYTPYAKTIKFDKNKITFGGIYTYIIEKQQDEEFRSKSIKVILSQEGRDDNKVIYLPESLLKNIDDMYFEAMTRAIESKVYSDSTRFEIYLSGGETIESFFMFLSDYLTEDKLSITFNSKENIQKYIVAHRFSKESIYIIRTYSLAARKMEQNEFMKLMNECVPATSPFIKILIEKMVESGFFKECYQDILVNYGIAQ